jgi:hypothetical protein
VLDDRRRKAMPAIAERDHAAMLARWVATHDPLP